MKRINYCIQNNLSCIPHSAGDCVYNHALVPRTIPLKIRHRAYVSRTIKSIKTICHYVHKDAYSLDILQGFYIRRLFADSQIHVEGPSPFRLWESCRDRSSSHFYMMSHMSFLKDILFKGQIRTGHCASHTDVRSTSFIHTYTSLYLDHLRSPSLLTTLSLMRLISSR